MLESKGSKLWWTALSALFLIVLAVLILVSFQRLDYDWNFRFLDEFFWKDGKPGLILEGLWITVVISAASITIGSIFGIVFGLLLLCKEPLIRTFAQIYVEIFRNTPVLVQLYVVYFIVGTALNLSAEVSGVLALSLFCSSYVAEIFRGTIQNFDRGQWDAAKSLGLTPLHIATWVIAPQALRRMLPPLVGQFVSLVKDSSLVSVIAVNELTKAALNVVAFSFRSFETWFVIALLYLAVNLFLSLFGRWLERKLSAESYA